MSTPGGKWKLTDAEARVVDALLFNTSPDEHPIRRFAPSTEGWHINKDIAIKLHITNNNVPKITGKLLKEGIIEKNNQGYLDAKRRPASLDIFCLKETKFVFLQLWKHYASTNNVGLFMSSDYYSRINYRTQIVEQFVDALQFKKHYDADIISTLGIHEGEIFIAAMPNIFSTFLDQGSKSVQKKTQHLRNLFQHLSKNTSDYSRSNSALKGNRRSGYGHNATRKYHIPPKEYARIAEKKFQAFLLANGAFNLLNAKTSFNQNHNFNPESLFKRAFNHYLFDAFSEESKIQSRHLKILQHRWGAHEERINLRHKRKLGLKDEEDRVVTELGRKKAPDGLDSLQVQLPPEFICLAVGWITAFNIQKDGSIGVGYDDARS